jgi:hypothetical protein
MDEETQRQINELRKEIVDLRAALVGASSAFHQLRMYVIGGRQPTSEGRKRFDEYVSEIDRVVTPGGTRGFGTP